jgi:hypothetical protein
LLRLPPFEAQGRAAVDAVASRTEAQIYPRANYLAFKLASIAHRLPSARPPAPVARAPRSSFVSAFRGFDRAHDFVARAIVALISFDSFATPKHRRRFALIFVRSETRKRALSLSLVCSTLSYTCYVNDEFTRACAHYPFIACPTTCVQHPLLISCLNLTPLPRQSTIELILYRFSLDTQLSC